MFKLLALVFAILICFGCGDDKARMVDVPDDTELDLDQDGTSDFVISYIRQTEADPAGNYEAIRMNFESSDIDQVLKNEDKFPVFLSDVSAIKTEAELPFFWETTSPSTNTTTPIATIRTGYDQITWNDEWTVFSLEESETYLIGFKLIGTSTSELGYIEFSIDAQTGQFILLKTEFL